MKKSIALKIKGRKKNLEIFVFQWPPIQATHLYVRVVDVLLLMTAATDLEREQRELESSLGQFKG